MSKTKQLTFAAMALALGSVLPQVFHSIPNAGNIFLPMHIPVIICGVFCGPGFGLLNGLLTPILSHLFFGMPPAALLGGMVVELGTYGLMAAIFEKALRIKPRLLKSLLVLILTTLIGKGVYGAANALFFRASAYSFDIWLKAAFIVALPGLAIQVVLVPLLIEVLSRSNHSK